MDIKFILAVASVIVLIIGYIPYFKDIFAKTTQPHAYTWLIWAITQGTATAAAFYGGAQWGLLSLAGGTLLVILVFLLSFKYGTRNIKRSDKFVLTLALSTILVWWLTKNPFYSVVMVTVIDGMGYIPTLRKSWEEPWSETLSFWLAMAVVNALIVFSLGEFNRLTVPYPIMLGTMNILVLVICLLRRQSVPTPVVESTN